MENGKYMREVSGATIVEKHRPRGAGISGKATKKTENRVWDHGDETHGVRSGQSGRGADFC